MPEAVADVSIAGALAQASELLAEAGCDTPRLDAELLLASALGVTRARLVLDATSLLDHDPLESYQALLSRRTAREPIAYILGVKEFRRISLAVDRRVLIPRPETECLVEAGLTLAGGAQVVDVGTGSGAVALALKDERPDLSVVGTDISADALVLARENASALGLDVLFVEADLLGGGLTCDAVLANLPYVAEDSSPSLATEIVCLRAGQSPVRRPGRLGSDPPAGRDARRRVRGRAGGGLRSVARGRGPADARRLRLRRALARPRRSRASRARAAVSDSDAEAFERCLGVGGVAIFPTDTVYGLACDPGNRFAVERLYLLKRRSPSKPSAIMFFDLELALVALPELGPRTRAALERLLPGALTALLPNPAGRFSLASGRTPRRSGCGFRRWID